MKKLLCLLSILLFASALCAADYTVSGGDVANAMGDYTYGGKDMGLGYDYYSNGSGHYMYWDGSGWIIGTQIQGSPGTWVYGGGGVVEADPTGSYISFADPGDEATCGAAGGSDYTVTFTDGNALNGISIALYSDSNRETEIDGSPLTTAGSGTATIDLPSATYYYTASKLHYTTQLDDITVADTPLAVNFTMLKKLIRGFLFFLQ